MGTPAEDRTAIERYRYLLRTAPPENIEEAHADAFARLTPAQRRQVLERLADELPAAERPTSSDDPGSLARAATRAEMRRPGTLERVFGGAGMGGLAGGLLAGVALAFVGSAVIDGLFDTGLGDMGLIDVAHDSSAADIGDLGFGGGDFGF
jgi:hypothetical protein